MSRYTVDSFTTASVAGAGGVLDFDRVIENNYIDLYKIKITPSGGTGTTVFSIFKAAARTAGDLTYATKPWTVAVYYDPVEDNSGVYAERGEGFVCRYEDADIGLKLRCRIVNNDAAPRTYDIAISYDLSPFSANVIGVPDGLKATGVANGLSCIAKVTADINKETITEAEFRAKRINVGDLIPSSVDLRTAAEGGTFAHNGTTQLIVTGLGANQFGCEYRFTSNGAGRWFFAWKLKNSVGWSKWTDGNATPTWVTQWFETSSNSDTGPAAGWQVTIEQGPTLNTVIVRATRPTTNGNVINGWAVQVKDSSTGSWRLIDAGAGASEVHYDGSGANHTIDPATGLISKVAPGWGTAAVGDLVVMDVRGNGSYTVDYCNWAIIKAVGSTTLELYGGGLKPLPTATFAGGVYTEIRLKVCKPPWNWDSEGYMGGWAVNGGYWDYTFGNYQWVPPDTATKEFVSDPIPVDPTAVSIQARVWYLNGYSMTDGNIIFSANSIGGPGVVTDGFIWTRFSDREWWVPAIQQGDAASLALNAAGTVTSGMVGTTRTPAYGMSGVAGRFRILPNPSGIVQVRVKWTVTQLTMPSAPAPLGQIISLFMDMEGWNAVAFGGPDNTCHGFGGQNLRVGGPTQQLQLGHILYLSPVSFANTKINDSQIKANIGMPGFPFDLELRLKIEEDIANLLGGGCTVWKLYEYQISGGGWNTVPLPAPAETMYDRRASSTAIRGYRPSLMFLSTQVLAGDNITLKEFEIIKGMAVKF